ncbi:Isoleucine--tRNA ligase [compost metagenome]
MDDTFKAKVERVKELILSETNIKAIDFISDTDGFIKKKIKPNFKALGAKVGKDMKLVAAAITGISPAELVTFEQTGNYTVPNTDYRIDLSDVEIIAEDIPGWQVTNMGNLTVALDVSITPELKREGLSRELINRIQNLRKELNYEVTDRITVNLQNDKLIADAVLQNKAYICEEILANTIQLVESVSGGNKITIEDVELQILISKH